MNFSLRKNRKCRKEWANDELVNWALGIGHWVIGHFLTGFAHPALLLLTFTLSIPPFIRAAEIFARRMEILRLPQGQATLFRDSVAIQDGPTRIVCGRALLIESRETGVLSDSVYIQTPEVTIWADSVEYYFQLHHARLINRPGKKVLLRQDSIEILTPRIEYYFPTGLVKAPGGLEIKKLGANFRLTGSSGSFNTRDRSGVIDSLPALWTVPTEEASDSSPVLITARKIFFSSTPAQLKFSGSVKLRSGSAGLNADTLLFYPRSDSALAWGSPIVFDTAGSAKSDTITLLLTRGLLHQLLLNRAAEAKYRTANGDEVLITSSQLSLILDQGKIERITLANLIQGKLIRAGQKPLPR
jgi:lipopolysaccharide export system protein LptA